MERGSKSCLIRPARSRFTLPTHTQLHLVAARAGSDILLGHHPVRSRQVARIASCLRRPTRGLVCLRHRNQVIPVKGASSTSTRTLTPGTWPTTSNSRPHQPSPFCLEASEIPSRSARRLSLGHCRHPSLQLASVRFIQCLTPCVSRHLSSDRQKRELRIRRTSRQPIPLLPLRATYLRPSREQSLPSASLGADLTRHPSRSSCILPPLLFPAGKTSSSLRPRS